MKKERISSRGNSVNEQASLKSSPLILNYSDGRVRHTSFTGSLSTDAFTQNDVIYIGGTAFFKRKK